MKLELRLIKRGQCLSGPSVLKLGEGTVGRWDCAEDAGCWYYCL